MSQLIFFSLELGWTCVFFDIQVKSGNSNFGFWKGSQVAECVCDSQGSGLEKKKKKMTTGLPEWPGLCF